MPNYVVTGGAGFIGSHIVEELLRRKETGKVIADCATGKRENVNGFANDVELIKADISTSKDLVSIFRGADYVIHQAAIPSVPKSMIDPVRSHDSNVNGTLNV